MKVASKGIALSETVEVLILNNTASKYNFPDNQSNLDNALIHAIAIHVENLTASANISHSVKGKPILPVLQTQKGFLTLADAENKSYNSKLPLSMWLQQNYCDAIYIKPRKFNIRDSYVDLPQLSTYGGIPPGGMVILFTFFYTVYDPAKHTLNAIGELETEDNY